MEKFEVWGRDDTGEVVKKRWPDYRLLAQTVRQFLDYGLAVEVMKDGTNKQSDVSRKTV